MKRTVEQNAEEFGVLTKQGKDVRLALLVGCSVAKLAKGQNLEDVRDHEHHSKVTAKDFAVRAGTSADRVLRHLTAWNKFAKLTGLPVAADLNPGDAVTLDITEEQANLFYKEVSLAATSKIKDIIDNGKALTEAIKSSPKAREIAAAALAGTTEAIEIATEVMSHSENAEVVLARPGVNNAVVNAQVRNAGFRPQANPTSVPRGSVVGSGTLNVLTLMDHIDRVEGGLNGITAILEGNPDDDTADNIREWLTDVVLLRVQGMLVHPALTGEEITPQAFGA